MKVQELKVDDLIPYENNPRKNDAAVDPVANSIKEFGFRVPIIIDKENVIVAGHTRYKAALKLGLKKVPCVVADDLAEEQINAFRLADNKTAELAGWDFDMLACELADIANIDMNQFGFNMDDLEDTEPEEVVEDEIPETVETKCKPGDIWQLGNHRLICGDSTDINVIDKLMDGHIADIAITSPPYGEQDSAKLRDHYVKGKDKRKSLYNQHDDKSSEWKDLMYSSYASMKTASKSQFINVQMLAANKRTLVQFVCDNVESLVDIIVWDKKKAPPQMQKNILNNQYEFIFIFSAGNNSRTVPFGNFHGNINNVIELSCGQNEYADIHRAVYPVELPANIMKIADKAETVIDVFGGTGTTLIACEQLNRKCYMCELDPHYCDVIIQRWENFTGEKAELIHGQEEMEKQNKKSM